MTPAKATLLCVTAYLGGIASFIAGSYLWLGKRL